MDDLVLCMCRLPSDKVNGGTTCILFFTFQTINNLTDSSGAGSSSHITAIAAGVAAGVVALIVAAVLIGVGCILLRKHSW